jgi:hypothetical protein
MCLPGHRISHLFGCHYVISKVQAFQHMTLCYRSIAVTLAFAPAGTWEYDSHQLHAWKFISQWPKGNNIGFCLVAPSIIWAKPECLDIRMLLLEDLDGLIYQAGIDRSFLINSSWCDTTPVASCQNGREGIEQLRNSSWTKFHQFSIYGWDEIFIGSTIDELPKSNKISPVFNIKHNMLLLWL